MMQIRTITAGAREEDIDRAARAARLARERLEAAGYTVQTLRLALAATGSNRCADFVNVARAAEQQALDAGFDYVSIGPVDGERLAALPEALAATGAVFASAVIAGMDGTLYYETLSGAAEAMVRLAALTPGGFGNLRFAAAACVAPGTPFLPAAAHDGGAPWVAIGPEAAALAVTASQVRRGDPRDRPDHKGGDPRDRPDHKGGDPRDRPNHHNTLSILTELIEGHDATIHTALANLAADTGVRFAGCDWSLAPHPDPDRSTGAAVEAISGVPFGAWGTLAAVRGLTGAIRAARVTQLGFSGVMLPVLEDETLARRNTEGRYTVRDLLAFSAVCGTGLDTIPLPGATSATQVVEVLLEVGALAAALHKPLTARLMPIPGLHTGEMTRFDFPYFVNTRVMELDGMQNAECRM